MIKKTEQLCFQRMSIKLKRTTYPLHQKMFQRNENGHCHKKRLIN